MRIYKNFVRMKKRVIQILIWFEIVIVAPLLFLSFWVLSVLFYFCSKTLDFFKHGINVAVCLRSKFALSDKKRNLANKKNLLFCWI